MILTKKDIDKYLLTISKSKRTTRMIDTESISIVIVVPSRYVNKVYREINNELPVGILIKVVSDKISYKKGLYK